MEKDVETAKENAGASDADVEAIEATTGCILVVDDEKSLRWSLAEGLREDGYEVLEAEDGTECFAALDSQPVDVVLLDLKLPGEDGLIILQRIKDKYPDVTVVMMTAYGKFENAVKADSTLVNAIKKISGRVQKEKAESKTRKKKKMFF